ncbi:MAG: ATP-binding protein [Deltaproteobacteria bacterium]|nr:ATP-binding protein [Deltaproteobacteria bacterium]
MNLTINNKTEIIKFISDKYLPDLLAGQKDPKLVESLNLNEKPDEEPSVLSGLKPREWLESERNFPKYQKLLANLKGLETHLAQNPTVILADKIAESFHFSDGFERDFIKFITLKYSIDDLNELFLVFNAEIRHSIYKSAYPYLAGALGRPLREIEAGLDYDSPLANSGLLSVTNSGRSREVSYQFKRLIYNQKATLESPKTVVLGKPLKATLTREDYEHLIDDYNFTADLLQKTLREKTKGLNILFYGAAGAGKTEMAKTIAAQIGASLYAVSEESRLSPDQSRTSDTLVALGLTNGDERTILMVDEAEEVFGHSPSNSRHYNRLFFHRLLENNLGPIIWITNNVKEMDAAIIRRFSYAVKFDSPPLKARANIWKRELAKSQFPISPQEIKDLASDYDLTPSFTQSALKAANLLNDKGAIKKTLESLEMALSGDGYAHKPDKPFLTFNPDLANTDLNLTTLTQRILSSGRLDFSLCLYGVPGAGKSEYLVYLASQMGLTPLQLRASDLLNRYVGETEKRVAKAFNVAKRDQKFLIFDEADSFLMDRRLANHSWEVTQVNEMLTWMERHPYPFACATNFKERLDEASLRRFSFKVHYDYLTPSQTLLAFERFFGPDKAKDLNDLSALKRLTPGDFVLVARKAAILGLTQTSELVELLLSEQAAKSDKTGAIGFFN